MAAGPIEHHQALPGMSPAVQVAALFRPEFLLEIEAWAVIPEGARDG